MFGLRAINRGEDAIHGSITISFPKLTGNGAGKAVEVISSSNENGVDIYESGAEIASRGGQTVNATYLLVEQGGTEPWTSGQEKQIRLRVTPTSAPEFEGGTFPVNYRVTQEKQTWPPEGTASRIRPAGMAGTAHPLSSGRICHGANLVRRGRSTGGKGEGAVSGTVVDIDGQSVPRVHIQIFHVPSPDFQEKGAPEATRQVVLGDFFYSNRIYPGRDTCWPSRQQRAKKPRGTKILLFHRSGNYVSHLRRSVRDTDQPRRAN